MEREHVHFETTLAWINNEGYEMEDVEMERERVDFKTTLAWINADECEMEVIKMYRKHLEFKATIARIDAGLSSGDMYDIIRKGFKGYENFSDTELVEEYFNLTGKVVEIKESV